MSTRFLHTSDWQLGMTRHYLAPRAGSDDDPQARFSSDRIDAIGRIGEIARAHECSFVVVAGDVFETHNVSSRVIQLACGAMASISLPVYLLPGNHDSLEPGCIWDREDFLSHRPPNVTVIRNSDPIKVAENVELVGAPLFSRHPSADPVSALVEALPADGSRRILVGHGQLPNLSGMDADDVMIDVAAVQAGLDRGAVSYVALGDRHIRWPDDLQAAIRYSGTHETTRFTDPGRGTADVVEINEGGVLATPYQVGRWLHARLSREMSSDQDIDALEEMFADFEDPQRTIIRYDFHGHLSVAQNARLESLIESQREVFASLEASDNRNSLTVIADRSDVESLSLPTWAHSAAEELAGLADPSSSSPSAGLPAHSDSSLQATAVDALGLLRRLAERSNAGSAHTGGSSYHSSADSHHGAGQR